jgi:hypothetical protein
VPDWLLYFLFFCSGSYAPSSRSGAYDLPVTARRSLHGGQQPGFVSNIVSVLSSPSQLFSTVQSQLSKGYEVVKDRVSQLTGYHQGTPGSPRGTRFGRTSSQSSGSGGRAKGYNLRSRPVHSTPRDTDEQQIHHRKAPTKHRKDQQEEIDEEDEDVHLSHPKYYWNKFVHYSKKIFSSPIHIFNTVLDQLKKLKSLPLWLLIPLLLLLAIYACKSIIYFLFKNLFFFL